ncbi:hypothetical protein ACFQ4J_06670 [Laceyella tengchongensis]|jgi:hypothetical protein
MIDYIDVIPSLVQFLKGRLDIDVYGNTFPESFMLPALVVKSAGGTDFTRLQLLVRAGKDHEAMQVLINVINLLERYANQIKGIRVIWCVRETNPVPSIDPDNNVAQSWCYMRLEHLEAEG